MAVTHFLSPIGTLQIVEENGFISNVNFEVSVANPVAASNPILDDCIVQLDEYFEGTRKTFDLPLELSGTDFQRRVWRALQFIPFGKTASYIDIAEGLGNPKLTRAVGAANGKNPIAIIIPCHRIIGSDGSLTGYAGGLKRKKWLLEHESSQTMLF